MRIILIQNYTSKSFVPAESTSKNCWELLLSHSASKNIVFEQAVGHVSHEKSSYSNLTFREMLRQMVVEEQGDFWPLSSLCSQRNRNGLQAKHWQMCVKTEPQTLIQTPSLRERFT